MRLSNVTRSLGNMLGPRKSGSVVFIYASDDATIRGGSHSSTAQGSINLNAKAQGADSFWRKCYMKFDLSDISENVTSATLKMVPVSSPASINVTVYGIDDSADEVAWLGASITWDNYSPNDAASATEPFDAGIRTAYGSKTTGPAENLEIDVTTWVNLRKGDSTCTLGIGNNNTSTDITNNWYSIENADPSSERPVLEIIV